MIASNVVIKTISEDFAFNLHQSDGSRAILKRGRRTNAIGKWKAKVNAWVLEQREKKIHPRNVKSNVVKRRLVPFGNSMKTWDVIMGRVHFV